MKGSWFPVIIAFVVLTAAGALVSWVFLSRSREYTRVEVPPSYLETSDTSRFSVQPILLARKYPDDSLVLVFPSDKTESSIFLYDQANYNRLLFGDHKGIPKTQLGNQALSTLFGQPVINFSAYPEGKYYVHLTSCNFGGFLEIEILDKNH